MEVAGINPAPTTFKNPCFPIGIVEALPFTFPYDLKYFVDIHARRQETSS
jgi:hypothetical protein